MWQMNPYFVASYSDHSVFISTGSSSLTEVDAKEFLAARAKVKKDRFRIITLSEPDIERIPVGLLVGIKACVALSLDKPPAGSPNNFGIAGLKHWSKMLREKKNAQCWARRFAPGPNMVQALAGAIGQPGVWDWIETWGTSPGADRLAFADFLNETAVWTELPQLNQLSKLSRQSGQLWQKLADTALTDEIDEFQQLKVLKNAYSEKRRQGTPEQRKAIQTEIREKIAAAASSTDKLAAIQSDLFIRMADLVDQIASIEEQMMLDLRSTVGQ